MTLVRPALAAAALMLLVEPGSGGELGVHVTNTSVPVLCAEKDNVTLSLASDQVRSLRIEARHPTYLGMMQRDSFAADWNQCDMSGDPVHAPPSPPRRVTLYEEIEMWVVGLTFPTFWRPATATFRIGQRVESGLHLIQLWMIRPMGGEEVLVLYPQDGYWRLRPKAPDGMAPTAFGSSFLVGPVEMDGRPVVHFKEVAFDPAARTFTLTFVQGGSATVRVAKIDQASHVLDVTFERAVGGRPFAALRSMYVGALNNDVAAVSYRRAGGGQWHEAGVMDFKGSDAVTELWMGRTVPSRHNTSSPDMLFKGFGDGKPADGPAKRP